VIVAGIMYAHRLSSQGLDESGPSTAHGGFPAVSSVHRMFGGKWNGLSVIRAQRGAQKQL
jgi:hypothetical protein